MRWLALIGLAACMTSSVDGDPHQPVVGESHVCTVDRYCGELGVEHLGDRRVCADDVVELENRVAFECWDGADCAGGFCQVVCRGEGTPCLFQPEP